MLTVQTEGWKVMSSYRDPSRNRDCTTGLGQFAVLLKETVRPQIEGQEEWFLIRDQISTSSKTKVRVIVYKNF